ncbi:MAG: hypothetical protein IJY15_02445 [Thermoguttaceae bacterium]|nr:hypothetical protein [Thermoguttaceae bacterium]
MPIKELREKYGNVKYSQALNRAIRKEAPGGAAFLNALALAGKYRYSSPQMAQIWDEMTVAHKALQDYVARLYDLKTTQGDEQE